MTDNKNGKISLNDDELDSISGGAVSTVIDYVNVREYPGITAPVLATVPKGTQFDLTGNVQFADGYKWYEVTLTTGSDPGWVAAQLLGIT